MTEQTEQVGTDQALWHGRVSLYQEEDGGLVVAYQRDGEDEVGNHRIPGFAVKMMAQMQAGKGGLMGVLSRLRGGVPDDGT